MSCLSSINKGLSLNRCNICFCKTIAKEFFIKDGYTSKGKRWIRIYPKDLWYWTPKRSHGIIILMNTRMMDHHWVSLELSMFINAKRHYWKILLMILKSVSQAMKRKVLCLKINLEPLDLDALQKMIGINGFRELNFSKPNVSMTNMLIDLSIFNFRSENKRMQRMILNKNKISYMSSWRNLERISNNMQEWIIKHFSKISDNQMDKITDKLLCSYEHRVHTSHWQLSQPIEERRTRDHLSRQ